MRTSVRTPAKYRRFMMTTAIAAALASAAHAQQSPPAQGATGDATTVKEVVVTGQRAALQSAIGIKESADVILDAVSADDAGKLPDNSVTEVLQRLPGVNITRIQTGAGTTSENYLAEGTDLTVRGMDTVSQINNEDAFSAVNGRGLAWEDIPPELMRNSEIYKTDAAYLPEGAFGGVVNLNTNKPFDFKGLTVNGSVGGNYADYAGQAHPEGNLLVSDRWQTPVGEFGLLLDAAYSNLATKADGVQVNPYYAEAWDPNPADQSNFTNGVDGTRLPYLKGAGGPGDAGAQQIYVPQGIDFTERNDDRIRTGLYGAMQWRPNDQLQFGLTVFNSTYQLNTTQYYLFTDASTTTVLPNNATATFNSAHQLTSASALGGYTYLQPGSLQSGVQNQWGYTNIPYDLQSQYSQSTNQTTDITLDGEWKPNDRLDLKFALQQVDSSAVEIDRSAFDYAMLPDVGLSLSSYGSSALPKLSIPSGVNMTEAANYGYLATMDHMSNNAGTEQAFYLDGKYKFDNAYLRDVRFGVKVTGRGEDDRQTPWNYQQVAPYYDGVPFTYLTTAPKYSSLVNTGSWFNGQMGLPAQMLFPSLAMLQTNFGTLHQQLGTGINNLQGPIGWLPMDNSSVTEHTETVYLMADFKDDQFIVPFSGNVGFRVVADSDHASGDLLLSAQNSVVFEPNYYVGSAPQATSFNFGQSGVQSSGGHSQVNLLPSLNVQFLPTPKLHVRFSASEGLDRPSFAQLNPQGNLGGSYVGTYTQNWIGSLQGNPDLKPQRATQLDLSLEYYWGKTGILQLAGFYKSISDYIGTEATPANYTIPATVAGGYTTGAGVAGANAASACPTAMSTGSSCPQTIPYTAQSYFNEGAAATIQGLEVGMIRYADFLPAPWSNFGINANYTYIDSNQPGAMAYDMTGAKINDLPVTGLSKNTVNFAVMYDSGSFSARLAYNWRDSYLVTTSAYQTSGAYQNWSNVPDTTYANSKNAYGVDTYYSLPVFAYPTGELDGNLTFKLNKSLTWVIEASNITKETDRLYMGVGSETTNRSWYTADRRYTTALHFNF
jgi:iron complex outermembrane recepter protein